MNAFYLSVDVFWHCSACWGHYKPVKINMQTEHNIAKNPNW